MITNATPAHRAILRELFEEFYASSAVHAPIPALYHENALDELFSPGSRQRAYLFEVSGCVVGYALLSDKYSHEAGGLEWWLEECYVRPANRGTGLGHEFSRLLLSQADRDGVSRLRLEIEPGNDGARRLYESFGFQPLGYGQMVRKGAAL